MSEYLSSDCEPEVTGIYREFEGFDDEGRMETSDNLIYNCEDCSNKECSYWSKYN